MSLVDALRAEGGLLAAAVPADAVDPPGDEAVASVREGYELHFGTPRVITTDDPDLALLAGDRMYAQGLALLAERGDLAEIAALAEVIATTAQAHAAGDPERARAQWATRHVTPDPDSLS